MAVRIGICDSNVQYTIRFMEYANMESPKEVKVVSFSAIDSVFEYMEKHRLDILLLNEMYEDFYENRQEKISQNTSIFWLTGNHIIGNQVGYVYKYQSIENILDYILALYKRDVLEGMQGIELYGVYSPLGRCGKTRYAYSLCDANSLYIGFEDFCSRDEGVFTKENMDVMDQFFFCLFCHNEKIVELVEQLPEAEERYKYVLFWDNKESLKELKPGDLEWFLELLKREKKKKKIVCDFGVGTLNDFNILRGFQRVYVPVLEDEISSNKLEHFRKMLSKESFEGIPERITYVEVINQEMGVITENHFERKIGK